MRKRFLAAGAAGLLAIAAFGSVLGSALAQSSLTVHPRRGIPLPSYVTSSDDWLNPGNVMPEAAQRSSNYARLVEDPIGDIVPVGPDLGVPW